MQKHLIPASLFALVCLPAFAQLPEDALRASWTTPSGTARQQAIGGAMGSLGGEISSNFVNPAGLGLYRTNEIVLSPGWRFGVDKSKYLGDNTKGPSASSFNIGTSGFVTSHTGMNGQSNVFSVAVNRTANFNSNIHYTGRNDYSSGSEQYAEEFANARMSPDSAIGMPGISYGTRMALYTYLVDIDTINGQPQVIGQPQKVGLLLQDNNLQSSGGITEIAINLATGFGSKWFIGGGIGIPIMSYTRNQTYTESDASGSGANDFQSYTYKETYTVKGWGINAKLGLLFKPDAAWRVGFALHTPTVYGLTDRVHASMITHTKGAYSGYPVISISSDTLDYYTGAANSFDYNLVTPWKFILSGSYVFGGESANVKQQKGFVTADLEYITSQSSRFKSASDQNQSGSSEYYDAVNASIKSYVKNTLSIRVGGELKLNTLMARAGAAWYGTPYRDSELKADRLYLSTGIGYRNKGMFVDLGYVLGFVRDVSFPYRLADKANVFADVKNTSSTLLMTVGFKL